MKIIQVNNGEIDKAFDQLIEYKQNGEFAIFCCNDLIGTTDDVPDNYKAMDIADIFDKIENAIANRQFRLIATKRINEEHNKTL